MKNIYFIITIAIFFIAVSAKAQQAGTFTDSRDDKVYKTVTIGTQTWMAENLAFKVSNFCWAYDNIAINVARYGYLYNWETAKNVCPSGWHLPSNVEWSTLINYAGSDYFSYKKLLSTTDWYEGEKGTDNYGFTALPGGHYIGFEFDSAIGSMGFWWSSTEIDATDAYSEVNLEPHNNRKDEGCSVRCIRDL